MIEAFAARILDVIHTHQAWAPAIVFALALGESLAVVSLILPATLVLLGMGGLAAAAGLSIWPLWLAAVAGAVAGDALSYAVGLHFKDRLPQLWPLSRRPDLLRRGYAFFAAWGIPGVRIRSRPPCAGGL